MEAIHSPRKPRKRNLVARKGIHRPRKPLRIRRSRRFLREWLESETMRWIVLEMQADEGPDLSWPE